MTAASVVLHWQASSVIPNTSKIAGKARTRIPHQNAKIYLTTVSAEEAEAMYLSCLLVREGKSNAETLEVAAVLLDYAWLSHAMGKAEEAESKARRSLAIRERILGSQHPDVAKVLTGETLTVHGVHSVTKCCKESVLLRGGSKLAFCLDGNDATRGWHADDAYSHAGLGIILLQMGRVEEAKAQLQKAQQICSSKLGKDHPQSVKARIWLLRCSEKIEG